jgi:hypothetical protein
MHETEKDEVELLGGRASEGVSEPLAKSQSGLTNVRMVCILKFSDKVPGLPFGA